MRGLSLLTTVHRLLGSLGCMLFTLWFASGMVMIYAGMPVLEPADRYPRLPALDLSLIRYSPAEAVAGAGAGEPVRVRVGMLGDRPVYRILDRRGWFAVFADDGQPLAGMSSVRAVEIARSFERGCQSARSGPRLERPDQWTLQLRDLLPLHRVDCRDRRRTRLYVSERTGEVVLETTRSGRLLGLLGPVVHWWYFTPLRRHAELWSQTLIWGSLAGGLLALTGLVLGVLRWARRPPGALSPYAGLLRWHHLAGLVFGVFAFTWIASGGLSLDPWDWHAGTEPDRRLREAVAGGPLHLARLGPDELRAAGSVLGAGFAVRELEVGQWAGVPHLLAYAGQPGSGDGRQPGRTRDPRAFLSPVQPFPSRRVALWAGGVQVAPPLDLGAIAAAARAAMPRGVERIDLLERYDAYYADRSGGLPLPVVRVIYRDRPRTWLYFDPARALVVRREERSSRANRWLYRAAHRLDFPGFATRRPLWDVVVVSLLAGGLLLSASPVLPALRRFRAFLRRVLLPRGPDRE